MSDWFLNLPVLWMGAMILGAIYVVTAGLYLLITALAVGERARAFKAISPGILSPLESNSHKKFPKKGLYLLAGICERMAIASSRGRAQCRERHAGGIAGSDGGRAESA